MSGHYGQVSVSAIPSWHQYLVAWITVARFEMDGMKRSVDPQKVNRALHFLLLAICLLPPIQVCAEEPIEHPFIEPKDIKSQTCLTCHPEKKEGKFVHSAVRMGCENCHQAISEKNKTTITLVATGGDLCAKCHETRKDPVLHGPIRTANALPAMIHIPRNSRHRHGLQGIHSALSATRLNAARRMR